MFWLVVVCFEVALLDFGFWGVFAGLRLGVFALNCLMVRLVVDVALGFAFIVFNCLVILDLVGCVVSYLSVGGFDLVCAISFRCCDLI